MEVLAFFGFLALIAVSVVVVVGSIVSHCSAHDKIRALRRELDAIQQKRVGAERLARAVRLLKGDEALARAVLEV